MSCLLELNEVSAGYGSLVVLRDVSFSVSAGEVVVMLGPNGAGKTTSVMAIGSFLPVLKGSVSVLGEPPPDVRHAHRSVRRGLGLVLDHRGLFPMLTARQHLSLASGTKQARTTLAWILEFLPELESVLDRRCGLLSGGQQQMVALARALARRPKLLVVDEMSMGLAPLVAARLAAVLRQLAIQEGVGVLAIEQHIDLALSIADRAVVLERGSVVAVSSADELAQSHEHLENAYFGQGS